MIRALVVALAIILVTPPLGLLVIVASLLGIRDSPNGVYQWASRTWARSISASAGMRIRVHGSENAPPGESRIYVSNHTSWFDIFGLAAVLRNYTFIAKAELERLFLFGRAARSIGIVFIQRENRKAAFESYRNATAMVRTGKSVIVCPEGTRGYDYSLRPFKKGPFVLAISAGVPIVPTIVHGVIEVQSKGSFAVHPGTANIHFLPPVETAGYDYDQRDELMRVVWQRMADALHDIYGVESSDRPIAAAGQSPIPSSFL
jgi:1-acyl-sn-glycerol-3-phosphate acyltransferase